MASMKISGVRKLDEAVVDVPLYGVIMGQPVYMNTDIETREFLYKGVDDRGQEVDFCLREVTLDEHYRLREGIEVELGYYDTNSRIDTILYTLSLSLAKKRRIGDVAIGGCVHPVVSCRAIEKIAKKTNILSQAA
jgi:hypothetical protein